MVFYFDCAKSLAKYSVNMMFSRFMQAALTGYLKMKRDPQQFCSRPQVWAMSQIRIGSSAKKQSLVAVIGPEIQKLLERIGGAPEKIEDFFRQWR